MFDKDGGSFGGLGKDLSEDAQVQFVKELFQLRNEERVRISDSEGMSI